MKELERDLNLYHYFRKVTGKFFNDIYSAFNEEYCIDLKKDAQFTNCSREELAKYKRQLAPLTKEGKKLCGMFSTIANDRHCRIDKFNEAKFNPPIEFTDTHISEDEILRLINAIADCYNKATDIMYETGIPDAFGDCHYNSDYIKIN